MKQPRTAEAFLSLVERSGLLPATLLLPYQPTSTQPPHAATPSQGRQGGSKEASNEELASRLVRDQLLTRFQAKQLLRGKYRGFFLTEKYKILEHVGSGGMGQVFLCEHLILHRLVAIKLLTAGTGNDSAGGAVERFYREARAVAALDHPNIVKVHDVDQSRGQPFMVMEYIDGTDLHQMVERNGPLDFERAANYIRQGALGLQHAHESGLVHRDVKPANLLIDRNGAVKLLDMGLARFLADPRRNQSLTQKYDQNVILGTADFMSPEQAANQPLDIRSDIYSLGCTLYYLLTGQLIFPEGTAVQKMIWQQYRDPAPVSNSRPDIPEALGAVLAKMLMKNRDERFPTPADAAEQLTEWGTNPLPPPESVLPKESAAVYQLGLSPSGGVKTPTMPLTPGPGSSAIDTSAITSNPDVNPERLFHEDDKTRVDFRKPRRVRRWKLGIGGAFAGVLVAVGLFVALRTAYPERTDGVSPSKDESFLKGTFPRIAPSPDAKLLLRGGGSTFVGPMMLRWAEVYEQKTGVRVEYTANGSGKGVEEVIAGKVEFGCTDAALDDVRLALIRKTSGNDLIHIPLVLGAVVPVYNLPEVPGQLKFTGPLLADIFLGKVKQWHDPAIRINNPAVAGALPPMDIVVIHRDESSGTTFIWSDFLSRSSAEWKDKVGVGSTLTWPRGQPGRGNDGVAALTSQKIGAIGYVESTFALSNNLKSGMVKNRKGLYLEATPEGMTAAAANCLDRVDPLLRFALTDAQGEASYPITGAVWAVIRVVPGKRVDPELLRFLRWVTQEEAQSLTRELRYAPLPSSLTVRVDRLFGRLDH